MPEGGQSIIGAPPKCGKSTVARCLAAAVAGARDERLGRKVEHGPVLYVSLEGAREVVWEHLGKVDPDGRVICTTQAQNLQAPEARLVALEHAIEKHRPRLVVIDTLVKFLADLAEMNDYTQVCRSLSQFEAILPKYGTRLE